MTVVVRRPVLPRPPAPPSDAALPVRFRVAAQADWPFLFNSWLKSYEATVTAWGVPPARYYETQHGTIERILERGQCLLAEPNDTPDVYAGHVVYEVVNGVTVVHFVYVKQRFRRMGLARALLAAVNAKGGHYTHHTRAGAALAASFGLRYAPEKTEQQPMRHKDGKR